METAAREFAISKKSLMQKLSAANLKSGDDDCFSTIQILEAIYGNTSEELRKAQIENTKQQAKLTKTKDAILKREWIPAEMVEKVWSDYIVDLRQKVQSLNLPAKDRADILADMQSIPVENYFMKPSMDKETEDEV